MASDYDELNNTIRIVEACLLANRPDRIVPRLRQGRSAEDVERELAAEVTAATQAPPTPDRMAARAPAAAQATSDALAAVIEARFRKQNKRPG
jgi:hypothetical protein